MPQFLLIEESAVGFGCCDDDLFDDKSEALNARDTAMREAKQFGIPVHYRLFELMEVDA